MGHPKIFQFSLPAVRNVNVITYTFRVKKIVAKPAHLTKSDSSSIDSKFYDLIKIQIQNPRNPCQDWVPDFLHFFCLPFSKKRKSDLSFCNLTGFFAPKKCKKVTLVFVEQALLYYSNTSIVQRNTVITSI